MMMTGEIYILANVKVRATVHKLVDMKEDGTRVLFAEPSRTLSQSNKMWAMLTEIANQVRDPYGQKLSPDEWKVRFLDALGRETKFIPALDRAGFIPYGQSSRKMTKSEMSDMLELMFSFAAKNGVVFTVPDSALPVQGGSEARRVAPPPPAEQGD